MDFNGRRCQPRDQSVRQALADAASRIILPRCVSNARVSGGGGILRGFHDLLRETGRPVATLDHELGSLRLTFR